MNINLKNLMVLMFLFSCGTYNAVTLKEGSTYIQFLGRPNGEELYIDSSKEPVILGVNTKSFNLNGVEATKIEVSKGTHKIQVIRNGNQIINRKIYISQGDIFELELPQ